MVDIDEIDEKLLSLLHNNPRESAEVLAEMVKLSPSTVRRRIDKLAGNIKATLKRYLRSSQFFKVRHIASLGSELKLHAPHCR